MQPTSVYKHRELTQHTLMQIALSEMVLPRSLLLHVMLTVFFRKSEVHIPTETLASWAVR